ncbi:MAG TPA: DNA alkylation repair protein [Candidatus Acidoferrales bacterium]|nr:DNA alkylation repair protein [Candidatus Acidoferrales bacterium]
MRRLLRRLADPSKASRMQAYMKSAMPYYGVTTPILLRTCKQLFSDIELEDARVWLAYERELWRGATHREERYAAILLSGDRRAHPFQTPAAMPLYEEMIVTGAWWDFVDPLASRRVGPILKNYPVPMKKTMVAWSKSDDVWKRRASILCQLGFKSDTDRQLLYACIRPSIDSNEFFLRKAIGWALRQLARTDPGEVKRYVRQNEARLSGLSKREALKHIAK